MAFLEDCSPKTCTDEARTLEPQASTEAGVGLPVFPAHDSAMDQAPSGSILHVCWLNEWVTQGCRWALPELGKEGGRKEPAATLYTAEGREEGSGFGAEGQRGLPLFCVEKPLVWAASLLSHLLTWEPAEQHRVGSLWSVIRSLRSPSPALWPDRRGLCSHHSWIQWAEWKQLHLKAAQFHSLGLFEISLVWGRRGQEERLSSPQSTPATRKEVRNRWENEWSAWGSGVGTRHWGCWKRLS